VTASDGSSPQAGNLGAFLHELRKQHGVLKDLNAAALERVLSYADEIEKMRGQLVEEFGYLQLEQIAGEMGFEYSLLRGDQIRDRNNQPITDGMIVRKAENGFLVVWLVEAKAGRPSRRDLITSRESFDKLSKRSRLELQLQAVDEFRERHGMKAP
jgi:hypothetical protein